MRASLIDYTWKSITGYSYCYVLITEHATITDINESGKPIVIFGWRPETAAVITALHKKGMKVSIACDPRQIPSKPFNSYGIKVCDYREILSNSDKYFFIVYSGYKEHNWTGGVNNFKLEEYAKLIQYADVKEFGIIYEGFTKDFRNNKFLQSIFFKSVNEIFDHVSLLNNWSSFYNLCRSVIPGAGYWDVLLQIIYNVYRTKHNIEYFEAGPGIGIFSLCLKKILDIDITWLTIPDEEKLWLESREKSVLSLLKEKYGIKMVEGYLEIDSLDNISNKFDIVALTQVMEHFIFNPVNSLVKLKNLMKDDGILALSVPEEVKHYNVESYKEMPFPENLTKIEIEKRTKINNFGHFHEYSYNEAMEVFAQSGLECLVHKFDSPIHHFILQKAHV